MLQVAAYCRVSTDKEDQANSFEAQQRYFREYIQRQPDWELQGIYADEGFSGTSTNKRVEFNKMLHAAELGQIDLIVTKEVSRFTRNTVDALQITRELRRRGVKHLKVVYSTEPSLPPLPAPAEEQTSRRQTPGSTAFVPAVAGLIIAGEVVRDLTGFARKIQRPA